MRCEALGGFRADEDQVTVGRIPLINASVKERQATMGITEI